jgi:DNA-binding PadR family transcriptional regulator
MIGVGIASGRSVSPFQLLLLLHLNQNASYGYDILKNLKEEFQGLWEPKSGTLYPALRSLANRGLISAYKEKDMEFYRLTAEGEGLLQELGERFEHEQKIGARYFRTIIKWMPATLRGKVLGIIDNLSRENIDVFSHLLQFLDRSMDHQRKLEILDRMRDLLATRLGMVERLYEELMEESGP